VGAGALRVGAEAVPGRCGTTAPWVRERFRWVREALMDRKGHLGWVGTRAARRSVLRSVRAG